MTSGIGAEAAAVMNAVTRIAADLPQVLVPVMRSKYARGWPEHQDVRVGDRVEYTTVTAALTKRYMFDAHIATYSTPTIDRRLAGERVFEKLPDGVPMVLFLIDVEPERHAKVTPEWWACERAKLARLLAEHPGGFVYRTRGGYRVAYRLGEPMVLRSTSDAERWKATYLAWLQYVRERYGIKGDESCQDWTRLYRLPRVVRDDERQEHETIGDATRIGDWRVEVTIAQPERPRPREPNGTYIPKLGDFNIDDFMAAHYPGVTFKAALGARRWDIECPWKHEHSSKSRRETSVFAYDSGAYEFKCQHAHCADRHSKEFRKWHEPEWIPFDERPTPSSWQREETQPKDLGGYPDDDPLPEEAYAPSVSARDVADRDEFARAEDGKIYHTQSNIVLALQKLGVALRCDEFARQEMIYGLPGFGPRADEHALRRLRLEIDSRFGFRIGKEFFYDVTADQAWTNRFHPVRGYLDSLRWDGEKRIDKWLVDAGAEDGGYVRAVARLILVAAVRRVMVPGCKFDEMPVLESKQGTNKSSALRILAGRDEWFTDELHLSADPKEMMEQTAGKWIVEAGEMKGLSKGDSAALKSWLSRQVDEARMSYDRKTTVAPRQFVVIGTTNETEGYLKDATGNRRFWPVRIKRFDLEKLARERDQLWAEAVQAHNAGESIRLPSDLWGTAAVEQEDRRLEDPMVPILAAALGDLTGKIRVVDALRIVGVDGKATQEQGQRVGLAMRELNWERAQRRDGGKPVYWYLRGTEHERNREIVVEANAVGGQREITARWRQ